MAPLLRRDHRHEARREELGGLEGLRGRRKRHERLERLERLLRRRVEAADHLAHVQPLPQQILGELKELAGEDDDEVRAVSDLRLEHLRRHHQQLRRWVLHLELGHDRGRVIRDEELLQMVDHHLVHTVRAQRRANTTAELLCRLNVLERRLLQAGQVLVALLQHALHPEAATLYARRERVQARARVGGAWLALCALNLRCTVSVRAILERDRSVEGSCTGWRCN